jgi:hypothetical protein
MFQLRTRERVKAKTVDDQSPIPAWRQALPQKKKVAVPKQKMSPPNLPGPGENKEKVKIRRPHKEKAAKRLATHQEDTRFQRELKEMKETQDLDEVDDDVEKEATLYEWHAEEHSHRPKSQLWFMLLAAGGTLFAGLQLIIYANIFGALAIGALTAMTYYMAQKKPATIRYRLMIDGIALNNVLYHYRDLETFNVVYEPGEAKTVILRSKRKLSPYIHMEIGDADPIQIRDVLIEFLPEDQEMEEPLTDVIARRLGF